MKRTVSAVLSIVMILTVVFTLASCSSYNGIEKNFTASNYTVIDLSEDKTAAKIVAEAEDLEVSCTAHLLKKNSIGGLVLILELGAKGDVDKLFGEDGSATLKGLITDAQKAKCVNGNCVLVPLTIAYFDEAVELFNK